MKKQAGDPVQQNPAPKDDKLSTLTRELDEARARIEQYEREAVLREKGVPMEDMDYYAFKIGKLVTEGKDFKEAAGEYLTEHPVQTHTVRVDTGAGLSGKPASATPNEQMNALIRGAFK